MTFDELKALVPPDRYARDRERAWQTAAACGRSRKDGVPSPDTAFDLSGHFWWKLDAPADERLRLAFDLYRDMPCYAIMMDLKDALRDPRSPARELLWSEFRALLAQPDDRLSGPLEYALYVDFFEDADTVHEAWRELTKPPLEPRALGRVIANSCAVPWDLKAPFYRSAIEHADLHVAVAEGLIGSLYGLYGQADLADARAIFLQLKLPPDMPGLEDLRRTFGTYEAP